MNTPVRIDWDYQRVAEMADAGLTLSQAARELEVIPRTLSRYTKRVGIVFKNRYRGEIAVSYVRRKTGHTYGSIQRRAAQLGLELHVDLDETNTQDGRPRIKHDKLLERLIAVHGQAQQEPAL